MKTRVCPECNFEFTPAHQSRYAANIKYCGPKCRQMAVKRRNDENKKNHRWIREAFLIFQRDGFKCLYCGRSSYAEMAKLHIDHLVPASNGGKPIAANLVTSCEKCNCSKGYLMMPQRILDNLILEVEKRNSEFGIAPDQPINLSALHQIA